VRSSLNDIVGRSSELTEMAILWSIFVLMSLAGCREPQAKPVVPVDTQHFADVVVLIDGEEILADGSTTVEVTPETPVEVRFELVNDHPAPWRVRLQMTQASDNGELIVAAPSLSPASDGQTDKFTGTMQSSDIDGDVELTLIALAPDSNEETLIFRAPVQVKNPD
jgi:hypothetical protein